MAARKYENSNCLQAKKATILARVLPELLGKLAGALTQFPGWSQVQQHFLENVCERRFPQLQVIGIPKGTARYLARSTGPYNTHDSSRPQNVATVYIVACCCH